MDSSPTLQQQVASICDDAKKLLPGAELRDQLERIQAKLGEPLRVAVSGSVSSGKSTLVNALLGQVSGSPRSGRASAPGW